MSPQTVQRLLFLVELVRILVKRLLLYLMGLPKVLPPSGRYFLLEDIAGFPPISVLAIGYPLQYCTEVYAVFWLSFLILSVGSLYSLEVLT